MALSRGDPAVPLLDADNQCLVLGDGRVGLTPKTFALLAYLVENRGQLVTKEALLRAVWHDVVVAPGQVKQFIAQLRTLLNDSPDTPRFIETVHGRGYRFIGHLEVRRAPAEVAPSWEARQRPEAVLPAGMPRPHLIERDAQMRELCSRLEAARQGRRQICLVRGAWGAGKTALLSEFLRIAGASGGLVVLRGLCTDTCGRRETFFPLLDALDARYSAEEHRPGLAAIREHAPLWYERLPGSPLPAAGHELPAAGGSLTERLMREGLHLFERLAADRPVLLCMDDLQHADPASVELLRRLLARDSPLRLFVIAACGPTETAPARRALDALVDAIRLHDPGAEIPLPPLSAQGVAELVAARAPGAPETAAARCYEATRGHPLLASLVAARLGDPAAAGDGPQRWREAVREAVWHRLDALSAGDIRLLEVGSALGPTFSAAAAAAGTGLSVELAEVRLASLARAACFLRARGLSLAADETVSSHFEFTHALVREVVKERVSPSEIARLAAPESPSRSAHREQASPRHDAPPAESRPSWAHKRVAHPHTVSPGPEPHAPPVQEPAGGPVASQFPPVPGKTRGGRRSDDPAARPLRRSTDRPSSSAAPAWDELLGLLLRGEFVRVVDQGTQLLARSRDQGDALAAVTARSALGSALFHLGDFVSAAGYLDAASPWPSGVPDGEGRSSRQFLAVHRHSHAALIAWIRGDEPQARQRLQRAQDDAGADPAALGLAWTFRAKLCQFHADPGRAAEAALQALAITEGNPGLTVMEAVNRAVLGWADAACGSAGPGLRELERALRHFETTGVRIGIPWHLSMRSQAQYLAGDVHGALASAREGIHRAGHSGDRVALCELHRLEGEFLAASRGVASRDEALACFRRSLDIARATHARAWESRAARSLERWITAGGPGADDGAPDATEGLAPADDLAPPYPRAADGSA